MNHLTAKDCNEDVEDDTEDEEVEVEEDQLEPSSDDEMVQPTQKRQKRGKTLVSSTTKAPKKTSTASKTKTTPKGQQPIPTKIVLLIPCYDGTMTRKEYDDRWVDFDSEVKQIIYEAIGCDEAKEKPPLGYKIEGSPAKENPISLNCGDDWDGLCEDVLSKQNEKKKLFKVSITASPEYMKGLKDWMDKKNKSRKGKGKTPVKRGSGKSDSGRKFHFDSSSNGSNSEDDGAEKSMMEVEKHHIDELRLEYGKCNLHKPQPCKIARGTHTILTFNMLSAWARALANKDTGVTVKTPPKSESFRAFHHSIETTTPVSSITETPGTSSSTAIKEWVAPMMGAFAAITQMSQQQHTQTVPNTPISLQKSTPPSPGVAAFNAPSSDGFDMYENPYPTITDFFHELDIAQPQRNLTQYIAIFSALDFYHINELLGLDTDALMKNNIGMSMGNASFVLAMVQRKVRKVDKERKKPLSWT
ncbi:hypothetical protein C8J55DRAFT_565877 [Lentinula edodes]|uniref:Uncharacterized protein n=1 Tax=Lentinula lateritia TaxID=40482 RepID=A0A9W9DEY4_9AGAR|nr:hypothetical protein C8J55DRAFT_565877 [Lentinula edodes]